MKRMRDFLTERHGELPKLGYIADCQERFDRGEKVSILCMVQRLEGPSFLYRVRLKRKFHPDPLVNAAMRLCQQGELD